MAIPKIIHQIWLGPNRRPDFWMDGFRDYAATHSGWSYMLWDEAALEGQTLHNKIWFDVEPAFHGKADMLRYEILYALGGIYVDADSLLLPGKDLDRLLEEAGDKKLFAARGLAENGMITQGVIGAAPQNPLLAEMINDIGQNYPKRMMSPPWISTGPKAFDAIMSKHLDEIHLFPTEYFFPGGWHFDAADWEENLSKLTSQQWSQKHPNSYFVQFGYSTNHLEGFVEKQSSAESRP